MGLNRPVAIVTGASRGIGAEVVRQLQVAGYLVIGISLNRPADAADDWIQCDVRHDSQVEGTVRDVHARYGRIDALVNAAGLWGFANVTDTSLALWNDVIGVNLTGVFLMMRRVLPIMIQQRHGRIINIASIAGKRGEADGAAYSASKHGLIGLTRSAALQVAKAQVTVNAICPSWVPTDMLEATLNDWSARTGRPAELGRYVMEAMNPQNRLIDTEEVAALVVFLASGAARGINGQGINLCGGTVFS